MILEYHRPEDLQDALRLLNRKEIKTVPLGGGSVINAPSAEEMAVVDLQALGLDKIQVKGTNLIVGATATLQRLLETTKLPESFTRVIQHEASYNLRQVATVAGALLAADGRSPLAAALMAMDAKATLLPGEEQRGIGDLLFQRGEALRGQLVTQITLPLNIHLCYEYVARTPADLPIVCVAAALWPSGRLRLVLGGYGDAPVLALDGPENGGVEEAAESAYFNAGDQWASADFRRNTAGILARRCIQSLSAEIGI